VAAPGRSGTLLTVVTGAIHPYLAVMAFVLTTALFVRCEVSRYAFAWTRVAARSAGLLALLALTFWAFGYIGLAVQTGGGNWGRYGADLTTFFSSMGFSRYLPELPLDQTGSDEGFAYLGGGTLLLTLASLVLVSPRDVGWRTWRSVLPLGLACLALALFSMSSPVRFGGKTLVDLQWIYGKFEHFIDIFRSAGRFVWPLYYLLVAFTVAVIGSVFRTRPALGQGVLILTALVQFAEVKYEASGYWFHHSTFQPLKSATWELARGDYDHVALYPPQMNPGVCGAAWQEVHAYQYIDLAYRLRMTFNGGHLSRFDIPATQKLCRDIERDVATEHLDDRTIYVLSEGIAFPRNRATCGRPDGREVCVAAQRVTRFSAALK